MAKIVNMLEMSQAVEKLEAEIKRWQPNGMLVNNVVEAAALHAFKAALVAFEEQMKEFQAKNGSVLADLEAARQKVAAAEAQAARITELETELGNANARLAAIAAAMPTETQPEAQSAG